MVYTIFFFFTTTTVLELWRKPLPVETDVRHTRAFESEKRTHSMIL